MHKNSMNKVIIIGNLGRDPERRALPDGRAISNISVATTESYRDSSSAEIKEITEWHRCVAFGKTADYINQYVTKGRKVYVEGRLRTRKWQDKDGNDRYTTEILVDILILLDRRGAGQDDDDSGSASDVSIQYDENDNTSSGSGTSEKLPQDDDLPF
ncbi:TPA: single-stranded DNA-binding protein [Candidatus Marinimicrobia bacterium]|nr:MAG: Single-stranded DNA-binding protein [Marinimicrobia bacterium 46_47]KUK92054.1 MAG: Single-stranded DNA-binding protein [Marinimicrobia bacterium 46_43]HAE88001.1 single-stranded DNA-binding protein [Candidatus Neomarinimicrobiota bacterium]HBY17798.1 single-stranded DNA-binding protein [Candidatus Neomarinimicrobiota bacterium]